MKTLELHDLEDRITEVMQSVQDTGETVAVTKDGEIIAHLVPASSPNVLAPASLPDLFALGSLPQWLTQMPASPVQLDSSPTRTEIDARRAKNASAADDLQNAWNNFDRFVAELGVQWPEGVSAVDAIRDVRREL